MTVKHWTEADYYAASRRARRAWECSQPQLVLGLGETDGPGTTSLVGSSVSPSPPSPLPAPHIAGNPPQGREGGLDSTPGQEN